MHQGAAVPLVASGTRMSEALVEMSAKSFGCVGVTDGHGRLIGIVTDGDLRRHMTPGSALLDRRAGDVMTRHPVTIQPDVFAVEALRVMEHRKITAIVVVNGAGVVEGVVHLHDLYLT